MGSLPDGVLILGPDRRVTEVNSRFCRMTGVDADEVVGRTPPFPWWPPEEAARIEAAHATGPGPDDGALETMIVTSGGRRVPVEARWSEVRDADGNVREYVVTLRDVSRRAAAEQALRREKDRLRGVIDAMSEGVMVQSPDGRIAMLNPAAVRILGRHEDEFVGRMPGEVLAPAVHDDGVPFDVEAYPDRMALQSGQPCRDVLMGVATTDGQRRWVRASSAVVPGSGPVVAAEAVVTVLTDVTEAQRQSDLVRRQRDMTDAMLGAMGDALVVVGADRRIAVVNERFCLLTGRRREELLGTGPPFPWWPSGVAEDRLALLSPFEPSDGLPLEMEIRDAHGQLTTVEATRSVLRAPDGRPEFLLLVARDVSLRKAAESALRDSEERYRAAIATTRDGMVTVGQDGRVRTCNAAASRILGVPQESMMGARGGELGLGVVDAAGDEVPVEQRPLAVALATGRPVPPTLIGIIPPGGDRPRWVLESCESLGPRDGDGRPREVLLTLTDVTALRDAEAALRASEQRYRSLFGYSADAVVRITPDGRVIAGSPSVWRVLRFDPNDLPADPVSRIHPDDMAAARDAFGRMVAGDVGVRMRVRVRRGDDVWIWADVTGGPVYDDAGMLLEIQHSVRDVTESVRRERDEASLHHIAEVVAAGAEAPVVFATLARELAAVVDADQVAVVRFDGDRGTMVGYWRAGDPPDTTPPDVHVDLTLRDTAAAEIWRSGEPAAITEMRVGAGGVVGIGRIPHSRVALGVPVQLDGRVWGCLSTGYAALDTPQAGLDRMARYADLASIAIASTRERDRLRHAAGIDALTGLNNRRGFHHRLEERFTAARQAGAPLSLALIDVDGFGEFERTCEPGSGDVLLRELASRLNAAAAPADIVARVGDDEFAWLMPGVPVEEARDRVEGFRGGIGPERTPHIPTRLSVGVAADRDAATAADLIHRARTALRTAKRARPEGPLPS